LTLPEKHFYRKAHNQQNKILQIKKNETDEIKKF
jgi:hypothetical protein